MMMSGWLEQSWRLKGLSYRDRSAVVKCANADACMGKSIGGRGALLAATHNAYSL
jgi:hypothetical protein